MRVIPIGLEPMLTRLGNADLIQLGYGIMNRDTGRDCTCDPRGRNSAL